MSYIKETNIKVIFVIFGENFEPSDITVMTGLVPTAEWKKGDEIRPFLYKKENSWEISSGKIITIDLDDALLDLVEKIEPKINILDNFILRKMLMCKMYIVVEVWDNNKPGMVIDSKVIKVLSSLNCSIDIDLYMYDSE